MEYCAVSVDRWKPVEAFLLGMSQPVSPAQTKMFRIQMLSRLLGYRQSPRPARSLR